MTITSFFSGSFFTGQFFYTPAPEPEVIPDRPGGYVRGLSARMERPGLGRNQYRSRILLLNEAN